MNDKQKEIREGIDDALYKCRGGWLTIIELKQKLSDLGVVIKVDRELPQRLVHFPEQKDWHWFPYSGEKAEAQQEMLKVGYAAVESLIEGE